MVAEKDVCIKQQIVKIHRVSRKATDAVLLINPANVRHSRRFIVGQDNGVVQVIVWPDESIFSPRDPTEYAVYAVHLVV